MKLPMFHEATVKFTNEFIDSLPFSLSNYASDILQRFRVVVKATEDIGFVCVGQVQQIARFIDDFSLFVNDLEVKRSGDRIRHASGASKSSCKKSSAGLADLDCPQCSFKCKLADEFKSHVKCHRSQSKTQFTYTCSSCPDRKFSTIYMSCYLRHMDSVHNDTKSVLCEICGLSFTRADNLMHHKSLAHVAEPKKDFKCSTCSKAFKTKPNLIEHEKVHTLLREFACEFCHRTFKTVSSRRRHIAYTHMGIKEFSCNNCNKAFSTKQRLQSHVTSKHSSSNADDSIREITRKVIQKEMDDALKEINETSCSLKLHSAGFESKDDHQVPASINGESQSSIDTKIIYTDSSNLNSVLPSLSNQSNSSDQSSIMPSNDQNSHPSVYNMDANLSQKEIYSCVTMESDQGNEINCSMSSSLDDLASTAPAPQTTADNFLESISSGPTDDPDQGSDLDELLRISSEPASAAQSTCSQLSRPPSASSQHFQSINSIHNDIDPRHPTSVFTSQSHQPPPPSYEQSCLQRQGSLPHSSAFHPVESSGITPSSFVTLETHHTNAMNGLAIHTMQSTLHDSGDNSGEVLSHCNSPVHSGHFTSYNDTPQYTSTLNGLEYISTNIDNPITTTNVMDDRCTPVLHTYEESMHEDASTSESRQLSTNVDALNQLHTPTKCPPLQFSDSTNFEHDIPGSSFNSST